MIKRTVIKPYKKRPLIERFMRRVSIDKNTGCWLWVGRLKSSGLPYGFFDINSKPIIAHKWAYQNFKGAIPEGLQIDHLCNQPSCVNPDHLKAITGKENNSRSNSISAINVRKTHCLNGHEFNYENTYFRKNGRECRVCARIRLRDKNNKATAV